MIPLDDLTGYWRCPECGAITFEDDADLHADWHNKVDASFRAAFDAITTLDLSR